MDIKSLTSDEVGVFLGFLYLERERHLKTALKCDAWCQLWLSEAQRQQEEVEHIYGGIAEVKERFGIELEER